MTTRNDRHHVEVVSLVGRTGRGEAIYRVELGGAGVMVRPGSPTAALLGSGELAPGMMAALRSDADGYTALVPVAHNAATCSNVVCRAAYMAMAVPEDATPVGATEVGAMLGVRRQTVEVWQHRGIFPSPDWQVGGRPAWRTDTVRRWAITTGRLA